MAVFVLSPVGIASAGPPDNNPNNACAPADHPSPEQYGSGIDGMVRPPNYPSDQMKAADPKQLSYYDRYGTAGQTWYAVDMGCSDAMAMVGNSVSNVVFTLAKAFDRTTITIYQAAASESLLGWLKKTVDGVIHSMGNTFGAKYWSWVVILGALWLAWWGLIRRRASRVAEGTIWMVVAMVGLLWLIGRPGDFTTLGTKVSDGATAAFNAALPQSDASTSCLPDGQKAPNPAQNDAVTRNANGLWVTLVCKPWLMGEFGTDDPKNQVVQQYGARLLASQAVDLHETYSDQKPDLNKKGSDYEAVAKDIKSQQPGIYSLFQGKNWTSRLAVAFGALLAALVAGLLVLVIAVMLIILKISFLLLLVAGPIFLGIGIHPGIGRVIAVRWFELLLSTLLKQAALIGVLALLLWCYGLVMAESLPWGLQILLISLVTLAAFVYRKPFQHLFAAVGYSAVGSRKGEQEVEMAVRETRKRTTAVATAAIPSAAGYRLGRWGGKRDSGALAGAPTLRGDEAADFDTAGREVVGASDRRGRAAQLAAKAAGAARGSAPPLNLSPRAQAAAPAARASGGGLWSPRPSGSGGTARPPAPRAPLDSPSREEQRPSAAGGGSRPPSAPTGPSWGAAGKTDAGQGSGTRTPPRRSAGGGERGGRGRTGGGEKSGADGGGTGGTGGGRSRLGGGSGGRTTPRPESGGAKKAPPARGGASGARPDPASTSRRREETRSEGKAPPPLWSDRSRQDGPSMPFWLRPVKREEDDEQ
ncbi:type IV secretion system protein [Actinoallomurus spadix]|nr:type IV secretion system protein [Actinoallomurus spadix]MCO5987001.1 type IV secretion system protein [Actinoallomurus spadix]